MSYTVSADSVITSVFAPSSGTFLTCGGTNIAPKVGTTWANFSVGSSNFKYIFNSNKFNNGSTTPTVRGFLSTGTAPTTIKQFLYNNGNIQYVCGQFSLSSPITANNIMYFNPNASTGSTGNATFNNLSSIAFTGTPNAVNCMAFLNTALGEIDTTKLVIAGTFTKATIGVNDSLANIAILNVTTTPAWTINTTLISSNATIISATTTINSIIVIDNIIYVGGSNSTNCLFYSYNTTTSTWTDLLGAFYAGKINVLKKTDSYIAIGGQFTTLGTATNCNNVVLYTVGTASWTALGTGVTSVAASSPIYASPQVFALEYLSSDNILWVGGYFINVNGVTANSIALYDFSAWTVIDRNGDTAGTTTKGLLLDSGGTNPGVVYALNIAAIDTSVIVVGGSFRTSTTAASPNSSQNIFNLVKITTATTNDTKRNYTRFNSKSQ